MKILPLLLCLFSCTNPSSGTPPQLVTPSETEEVINIPDARRTYIIITQVKTKSAYCIMGTSFSDALDNKTIFPNTQTVVPLEYCLKLKESIGK